MISPRQLPRLANDQTKSFTSFKEKPTKIGAKVVRHGRSTAFQMAEVAAPRALFAEILSLIHELRPRPAAQPQMAPTGHMRGRGRSIGEIASELTPLVPKTGDLGAIKPLGACPQSRPSPIYNTGGKSSRPTGKCGFRPRGGDGTLAEGTKDSRSSPT